MGSVGITWSIFMNSREAAGKLTTVFDQTKQNSPITLKCLAFLRKTDWGLVIAVFWFVLPTCKIFEIVSF